MNQTQKRLNIIKLAISIGDTETIQLQLLKLAPLKTDEKIQEIIHGLQAENYAQTQVLITEYMETPPEEILQRTSQKTPSPEEEEALIEEFDLFRVTPQKTETEEVIHNQMPNLDERTTQEDDFDTLLSLTSKDVLTQTPDIQQTLPHEAEDNFFTQEEEETSRSYDYSTVIEQDDFFQTEETDRSSQTHTEASSFQADEKEEPTAEESHTASSEPELVQEKSPEKPLFYDPIPYIDQKLKTMQTQYPPVEEPEVSYPAVDAWLIKISHDGYSEKEVEETIAYVKTLTETGDIAQAAQLLLISAATQSKYAQFILARALFKGIILKKNLPEAFTLINRLAMDDDYPEAICDLGQLYENGIGIDKDKKRAEELFKEATELGIQRAAAHYERVHRENKGLLGKLFGGR